MLLFNLMEETHCDMCCHEASRFLTFNCKHIICYCCFYKILLRSSLKDIMTLPKIAIECICVTGKLTLTQEEVYEIVFFLNQTKPEQKKKEAISIEEKGTSTSLPIIQTCYYHNAKRNVFFCLECKENICELCIEKEGNHYDHQAVKSDEYLSILKNKMNHLPEISSILKNNEAQSNQAYLKYVDLVTTKFDLLINEINNYKKKAIDHVQKITEEYNQSLKIIHLLYKYYNFEVEQSSNDIHQLLFLLNTKIVLPEMNLHYNKAENDINYLIKYIQDLKTESIVDIRLKHNYCEFKCVQTIEAHTSDISTIVLLSKLKIATGAYDGTIKIWKMTKKGYTLQQTENEHKSTVLALCKLNENKFVSSSDNGLIIWKEDKDIYTINQRILFDRQTFCTCLGSLSNERDFVACLNSNMVQIYKEKETIKSDIDSMPNAAFTEIESFKGHNNNINSIIQLNDSRLVSASDDNTLRIWDDDRSFESLNGHKDCVNIVCLLDLDRIASGSSDKTIIIWIKEKDTGKYNPAQVLTGHTDSIRALVFLSDGRLISGSIDDNIKIWVKTRKDFECNMTLREHSGGIPKIISIDNESFVSVSWDKTIKVWYGIKLLN